MTPDTAIFGLVAAAVLAALIVIGALLYLFWLHAVQRRADKAATARFGDEWRCGGVSARAADPCDCSSPPTSELTSASLCSDVTQPSPRSVAFEQRWARLQRDLEQFERESRRLRESQPSAADAALLWRRVDAALNEFKATG